MDSQVREVEAAVRASGLRFDDVKWDMRDGQFWTGQAHLDLPTLVYWPDPSFVFSFDHYPEFTSPDGFMHDPGGHQVYFLPGRETPFEHRSDLRWDKVMMAVRDWLEYVAREKGINAPTEVLPGPIQGILHQYRVTGNEPAPSLLPSPPIKETTPPSSTRKSVHPRRERVLGSSINQWLEREAERRGPVWRLLGWLIPLIVGIALAVLL